LQIEPIHELLTGAFNPETNFHLDLSPFKKDSVHFVFRLYNDSATTDMAIRLMGALDVFRLAGNEITNTQETIGENSFLIQPNPAGSQIHLICNSHFQKAMFNIYNSCGQKIISQFIDSPDNCIDIDFLPAGIYFINSSTAKHPVSFYKK
jgi:adenine-specific DNA methylase